MSYSGLGTRRKGRKAKWEVHLPEHLATRVETLMVDPINKKPIYGARSQLVTELLELWASKKEAEIADTKRELQGNGHAGALLA